MPTFENFQARNDSLMALLNTIIRGNETQKAQNRDALFDIASQGRQATGNLESSILGGIEQGRQRQHQSDLLTQRGEQAGDLAEKNRRALAARQDSANAANIQGDQLRAATTRDVAAARAGAAAQKERVRVGERTEDLARKDAIAEEAKVAAGARAKRQTAKDATARGDRLVKHQRLVSNDTKREIENTRRHNQRVAQAAKKAGDNQQSQAIRLRLKDIDLAMQQTKQVQGEIDKIELRLVKMRAILSPDDPKVQQAEADLARKRAEVDAFRKAWFDGSTELRRQFGDLGIDFRPPEPGLAPPQEDDKLVDDLVNDISNG